MPTHKQNVLKKLGVPPDSSFSVEELASKTGIPAKALQEVYNRGIGAWKSNPASVRLLDFSKNPDTSKYPRTSRLGKEQWAMARVYSFIDRGKTFKTADADIARTYGLK